MHVKPISSLYSSRLLFILWSWYICMDDTVPQTPSSNSCHAIVKSLCQLESERAVHLVVLHHSRLQWCVLPYTEVPFSLISCGLGCGRIQTCRVSYVSFAQLWQQPRSLYLLYLSGGTRCLSVLGTKDLDGKASVHIGSISSLTFREPAYIYRWVCFARSHHDLDTHVNKIITMTFSKWLKSDEGQAYGRVRWWRANTMWEQAVANRQQTYYCTC